MFNKKWLSEKTNADQNEQKNNEENKIKLEKIEENEQKKNDNEEKKPEEKIEKIEEKKVEEKKIEEKKEEEKKENPPEKKNSKEITEEEIKNSPIIILEEEIPKLFNGKKIEINASGMIDGRNKKDGVVIFGPKNENNENNNNNNQNNTNSITKSSNFKPDFELNCESKYPYIFSIYYIKESKSFNIRAYSGLNNLLFIKLTNGYSITVTQKEIISAGNIIFQITPVENNLEIVNVSKKELSINPKQTFYPSSKKEVTIGRNKDCDFAFPKDKSFSRIQTTFKYDEENKNWEIIDGSTAKSSTNGTWVFGTHSFPIKNEMTIEVMSSIIKITQKSNSWK